MSSPEVALAGGYARSVTEMSESWKPDQMPRLTTTGSVRRAVAEYDRLGRKRFLETYGFGASRRYLLRLDGRLYESKAIVGVAFQYETRMARFGRASSAAVSDLGPQLVSC